MRLPDLVLPAADGSEQRLLSLVASRPATVLVLLRHFGWIFCREALAQLREHHDEIASLGAQAIGIGMGSAATARALTQSMDLPYLLLVDGEREIYRALEVRRAGLYGLIGPPAIVAALRALRRGFRQTHVESDPRQLGGTFIVDARGEIRARRASRFAGDHAPWPWVRAAILDALPPAR